MESETGLLRLPGEPLELKVATRMLLEHDPDGGRQQLEDEDWLVPYLWAHWGPALTEEGFGRDDLLRVARGYGDELRLWVMGERTWPHCISGLAGRVQRRLPVGVGSHGAKLAS